VTSPLVSRQLVQSYTCPFHANATSSPVKTKPDTNSKEEKKTNENLLVLTRCQAAFRLCVHKLVSPQQPMREHSPFPLTGVN
jgi:hypothetical protein